MNLLFPTAQTRPQAGSAVVVMLAMLAIMMIFVAANTVAIRSLGREIKLVDQKQMRHWQQTAPGATNSIQPARSLEKSNQP